VGLFDDDRQRVCTHRVLVLDDRGDVFWDRQALATPHTPAGACLPPPAHGHIRSYTLLLSAGGACSS
jgi:hypothetical protein